MTDELAEQAAAVGALADPARRALYLYVAEQPGAVSREDAAAAVQVPLHTAKFHLDRLVAQGLLEVTYRRLTGRTGPGAGRPAKLYRRSARQLSVTLPQRRYDLAGAVLAAAIERAVGDDVPVAQAVREAAEEEGRRIAAAYVGEAPRRRAGRRREELVAVADLLRRHGYEPRVEADGVRLANCPFDRLATDHTELVCGMNLALLVGLLDGMRVRRLEAELAPEEGFCCVRLWGK